MLFFSIPTKNNEVIADKPFQNSGVTRRLWRFQHATVLEWSIEVGLLLFFRSTKLSTWVKKTLACWVCGNALEKFAVKFVKNTDMDWSKSHEWWRSAVYNSVSKQGMGSFSSFYVITCCVHFASKVCSNTCAVALQLGTMLKSTEMLPAEIQRTVYWKRQLRLQLCHM